MTAPHSTPAIVGLSIDSYPPRCKLEFVQRFLATCEPDSDGIARFSENEWHGLAMVIMEAVEDMTAAIDTALGGPKTEKDLEHAQTAADTPAPEQDDVAGRLDIEEPVLQELRRRGAVALREMVARHVAEVRREMEASQATA